MSAEGRYEALLSWLDETGVVVANHLTLKDSLWDTFRSTHPLFTLIEPDRVNEFIATFLFILSFPKVRCLLYIIKRKFSKFFFSSP